MSSWDPKLLWLKAKHLIDKANENAPSTSEFSFWSGLALECLARSALTNIHPTLNADPRDDTNLLFALGFSIAGQPRSLPAHSVYIRLEKVLPKFTKSHRELCDFVAILRNRYLHTADMPYESTKTSTWLPRYYDTAQILCEAVGKTLADFLGPEIFPSAETQIKALGISINAAVKKKIDSHAHVFSTKSAVEQQRLKDGANIITMQATLGSTSAICPACHSNGLLTGSLIKSLSPTYDSGQLLERQIYLAEEYNCFSCELALHGVAEIAQANIEPQFEQTTSTSLHDLYEPEHYFEYDNM